MPHDGSNYDDDAIVTEPGWLRWRERWRAIGAATRALLVVAAVLAAAALVAGDFALHTSARRRERTVFAPAKPGPATVDSTGCPVRVRCSVIARVDPGMTAAVHRAFPGAGIISSVSIRDAVSGRMYRRVVLARSTSVTVIASAQCIPAAAPGPRRVLRAAAGVTGGVVSTRYRLEIVVPGRGGCSASIEADETAAHPSDDAPVYALAADPAVQLTP